MRRDSRGSKRGAKGKRRHVTEENEDESGDDSEAEPDMTESKGRDKKSVATAAFTTTPPRHEIDFSKCF